MVKEWVTRALHHTGAQHIELFPVLGVSLVDVIVGLVRVRVRVRVRVSNTTGSQSAQSVHAFRLTWDWAEAEG